GDVNPEHMTVVALSLAAWQLLHKRGVAEEFCARRTVFIVIADLERPDPASDDALLIVSDGVKIMTAGSFGSVYDTWIGAAFRHAHEEGAAPPPEPDDEEEM
ncbi:MAG: hypothetical protein O7H40_09285, partial [Gammaproteobacteria bacterium]|nr:hypothetical protein [Gammaproteobacteria bacterium]